MAFKLFVSYSQKDRKTIEPLLFCVRNMPEASAGLLDIFFYTQSRTPSAKATEEIIEKIHGSDAILYFHSKNSVGSEFVQNEVGGAVVAKKQVIIAKLDAAPVNGMLQGVNYLDLGNADVFHKEMTDLLNTVKTKIEAQQKEETAKAARASFEKTERDKDTVVQNRVGRETVKQPVAVVPRSYTVEDWKMVLALAAAIALVFVLLTTAKK
jgi:hypothetical protein